MGDIVERLRSSKATYMLDEQGWSDWADLHRDAADEIERLRAKTEWRPIETAPKDGTHFLAYEPTGDMYRAAYHREGYLCVFCGQFVTQTPEPTHWIPLPDASEDESCEPC